MVLPKLESNPRVGDQAFEAIHTAIMSGDFPSGYRLQIRELAADLGISVMPVREAIKRLKALELVEELPYRGAAVKTLTLEELASIYAVRRLLEVEATRLAVNRVSSDGLQRMERSFAAMVVALEEGSAADYLDRDEEILAVVYEASGNPVLLDTIRTFWYRCRPFKLVGAQREIAASRVEPLSVYQRDLIRAVRDGDGEAAVRVTAESLDAAVERIQEVLGATDAHGKSV